MEIFSGIYEIKNSANGKVYVGQSRNVLSRKRDHKRKLITNKHHNIYLQREFNKYGIESFSFNVLEQCEIEKLNDLEIKWIAKFDSMNNKKGYNLEGGGRVDKVVSEKVRAAKRGANNPAYGKKMSEEQKEMIRAANRASSDLLTEQDVADIKIRLCGHEEQQVLSKEYNVHFSTISKIATCKNWEWVEEELNEKLLNLRQDRIKTIKEMDKEGYSRSEIAKILHCSSTTIIEHLGNIQKAQLEEIANKKKEIVEDFKNGVPKKETLEKYGLRSEYYNIVVREAKRKMTNELKAQVISMRNSGALVKDIAKELGLHRTTVSGWTIECDSHYKTSTKQQSQQPQQISISS